MKTQPIDGIAVAKALRASLADRVTMLTRAGNQPGLAVIRVGDDPASRVYVRSKIKACSEAGIRSDQFDLPATATQAELIARIDALNLDPAIHGILVQLPLPGHMAADAVLESIAPEKDVDGFHTRNIGALVVGQPGYVPCTPLGIIRLLAHEKLPIAGRHAVVLGRSNIVGKPVALLLLHAGATVTICHSMTPDLAQFTRQADILVAAVGQPQMIKGDMLKPGAVVIDVGINRTSDGKLVGDCDWDSLQGVASHATPVPGGVGPMTVAMLLHNTVQAAERFAARAH